MAHMDMDGAGLLRFAGITPVAPWAESRDINGVVSRRYVFHFSNGYRATIEYTRSELGYPPFKLYVARRQKSLFLRDVDYVNEGSDVGCDRMVYSYENLDDLERMMLELNNKPPLPGALFYAVENQLRRRWFRLFNKHGVLSNGV